MRKVVTGLVATALLVGAPTAGWALGGFGPAGDALPRIGSLQLGGAVFTPSTVDPAVASLVAQRGQGGGLDRFTPAGADPRTGRTVTVAVRVDDGAGRFATVRPGRRGALAAGAEDADGLRITPTRYNLGVARGLQSFAKAAPVLSRSLSDAAIPNLADFQPSTSAAAEPESRFAARIAVEEEGRGTSTARPADPRGDQTVNLAGSYRLTRNLDVTAGVRYSQQQHRITPAQDVSHKEAQAVYIGTQFRF